MKRKANHEFFYCFFNILLFNQAAAFIGIPLCRRGYNQKWRISPKNIYFKKINQTIREMNQSGEKLNHNAKKKK